MASRINKAILKRKDECVYDECSGKDRERADCNYEPTCENCKCKIKRRKWIYFCTYCQCCRPKKDISGPKFQTEVCGIIVMVKKLIDSIPVTVSDLDF